MMDGSVYMGWMDKKVDLRGFVKTEHPRPSGTVTRGSGVRGRGGGIPNYGCQG
ncbi:hypothetical protein E2C01_097176 [Portunus trituberculatus]|uniref:Uncharacterized protein n=1 Tax=Portunus trituberculatus TaxID=210409 RepID=A0A5B7K3U1_PORTR|nr:hypothetical protein [Portunus trituberculatus]